MRDVEESVLSGNKGMERKQAMKRQRQRERIDRGWIRRGRVSVLSLALIGTLIITNTIFGLAATADAQPSKIGNPCGMILLKDGSWLITDLYYKVIWHKDGTAENVLAGAMEQSNTDNNTQGTEPVGGYVDDTLSQAVFRSPWDIAPYGDGYAITDTENNVVRFMDKKNVQTLAGSGQAGYRDGTGQQAALNRPTGVVAGKDGELYVADTGNHVIRKIDAQGAITLYAGSKEGQAGCADGSLNEARFSEPMGLYYKDGVLWIADAGNHRICKIENEKVQTVAGYSEADQVAVEGGYRDGSIKKALFSNPHGIAVAKDNTIYVADTGNGAIRRIKDNLVKTVIHAQKEEDLFPLSPEKIAIKGNQLFISDTFAERVFTIDLEKENANHYTDVAEKSWYAQAVYEAVGQGYFQGISDNIFRPEEKINRAMFITTLSRLHQSQYPDAIIDGEQHFADIAEQAYYQSAVAWAASNDLAAGTGELFLPKRNISRQELVTLLYRYAIYADDLQANADSVDIGMNDIALEQFYDHESIASWALPAYQWAVENKIMQGSQSNLNPQKAVTRAEAAQILVNFFHQIG